MGLTAAAADSGVGLALVSRIAGATVLALAAGAAAVELM